MDQDRIVASAESDMLSISDTSSQEENGGYTNTGGRRQPKNKMKLRSIKLSRLPSFGSCIRPQKSPSTRSSSLYSRQSTPITMPYASPNYTKVINSSDAKKGSLQKSAGTLTRRSSFKSKKLKKTRSIKVASIGSLGSSTTEKSAPHDRSSISLPSYLKADFQASPSNSESSVSSNDQTRIANSTLDSSVRVLKKATGLRPQRILTKTASFKSKRPNRNKCTEVSEIPDSNVERATCSSTLKHKKFPRLKVEVKTGEGESGGNSAMKVCPYTYCSLHGHHHGTLPPLKRFVSMRRRLLKNQKSIKPESRSIPKAKRYTNRRRGTQTTQVVCNGNSADKETIQDDITSSSRTEKVFKPDLNSTCCQSGEDKHISDCANHAEMLLGETSSHPHPSFEQQKTSDSLTAKPETQVAISAVQGTSEECCCITTEPIKLILDAGDIESKGGRIVASSIHSGDNVPILSVDHHKFTEISLPELKDSIQCNNLSLKLDGIVSSSDEEVPTDAIVHQEANRDRAAGLNLEVFKDNSKSHIEVVEASTQTRVIGKENNENFEPDNGFLEGNSSSGDSMLNSTTEEPHKTQMEKPKYTGFWGLIYQHMKSGIAAEVETELPLDGKEKEELPRGGKVKEEQVKVKDDNSLLRKNEFVSFQTLSGTDQNMGMGECDEGDQKFEPWQSDAIKLVQEAFDKILSEIPDRSSDDQSISSDITSEQDLLDENHSEGGERSISSSFERTKESIKQNPEESGIEAIDINSKTSEEEKAASKQENNSKKQISKNWSNLKKVIILKRFVKALEKVKNFNPRKPQFLPVEPDPETEKVYLRHQTMEERKNADEWMLDYALRQVISNLAPAQKRKVGLLVQAFETVTPPTDIKTRLSFNAKSSSHPTPVQGCTGSPIQSGEQNNSESLGKAPYLEMSFRETLDEVSDISTAERHIPGTCSELKERDLRGCSNAELDMSASETSHRNLEDKETIAFNLEEEDNNSILTDDQPDVVDSSSTKLEEPRLLDKPLSKPDDTGSTSHEEFLVNGQILPEVSKEVLLIYDSEIRDSDMQLNSKKFKSGNLIDANGEQSHELKSELSSIVSSVVSSASFCELSEEPMTACGGEANSKHEVLQESSPEEESEPHDTIDTDNLIDADGERSREPKSELSSIVSSVVSSTSFSELSAERMAACGGQADPKRDVQHSTLQEESEPPDTNDMEPENKLEKQKYMRLWYLIYKHMGAHPLEGADKEEQGGDANKLLETEGADFCEDSSEMNQKMLMDNQIATSQKIECPHIEAIKLIEEAIDDIHLPDMQDDSTDDQSITGNKIPEQDFQKKHGESREIFLSNSSDSAEDSFRGSNNTNVEQGTTVDPKEASSRRNNISALEESETESKLGNTTKPKSQKSWSNLKKLILLKRFVKALEKVTTFNPREPQYLHLDSDSEVEKVNLRHQNMEDRKNAEEWMLDHALQQVVAKLTPARKRKVELLIEAFETVTPSLEVKTHQQNSAAGSPHARLIHV
ncbi:hypothetical protein ACOSQ2_026920 [Xanthoceras sorbifolium]